MNSIILSGGPLGGQEVEWNTEEFFLTIEGFVYRFDVESGDTVAVYIGEAPPL